MATIEKLINLCGNDLTLLGAVQELEQLRKSQLQPAVRFLGNTIQEQLNHMDSEIIEVYNEIVAKNCMFDIDKLVMEIIDLQFSCQTMLEGPLCLTKSQIADYIQQVVKKNTDRGYDKLK